jgi:uncharacterized protein YndB with AHSA1/START domain
MTSDTDLPARPDTISVTYINASMERVWRAFTDPHDQATYFGGKTEIGEVGEPWIRHATDKWPAITGIVLANDPPSRLLITWGFADDPPPDRVEFLITPASNSTTCVTIKEYHSRDWSQDIADSAVQGWAALLAGLKTLVETGKPLPSPF